jgi:phosphopantothenoylcysteine decarboxylase/phosphopantothenate--cysteine ligase
MQSSAGVAKILITSGPTRQYLDPVRYISNASSGRMGCALAEAALELGHDVCVVSGPVSVTYPAAATVVWVDTTNDMLGEVLARFPRADGLIGAAAPCDYMPVQVSPQKIAKSGEPLMLQLIETPDIVASAAATKQPHQWVIGFALETEDRHFRAVVKMQRKFCDLMVSNDASAINSSDNRVDILGPSGTLIATVAGSKAEVARAILAAAETQLIAKRPPQPIEE